MSTNELIRLIKSGVLRQLIREVQIADPVKRRIERKYKERLTSLSEIKLRNFLVTRRDLSIEEVKEIISPLSRRSQDFILEGFRERDLKDQSGQEGLTFLEQFSTEFGEKDE